jgi:serine/threonine protein phosphatase PrpC
MSSPESNEPADSTGSGPPSNPDPGETLLNPEETPAVAEALPPPQPPSCQITVATGCKHVIGKVKENDQDYCQIPGAIDYPLHGFQVILATGADGIGGGTGGERWAFTTVHLFLAALGVRLPPFDLEASFVNREQFWQLLNEKLKLYFFPTINWVTGGLYNFGISEVGLNKDTQRPAKTFGATWVATAFVCDLKTGRVKMHAYCVGDPSLFLITAVGIEKLNTDDVRRDGTELDRWVGQGQQANGQLFTREFQFEPEKLPYLRVLMCSDGLTNMVNPEDIAVTARKEEPASAVDQLIAQALDVEVPYGQTQNPTQDPPVTPGDDNIFVGIISVNCQQQPQGATDDRPSEHHPGEQVAHDEDGA